MPSDEFEDRLRAEIGSLQKCVVSATGDWTVKGFIDLYKRVYTISLDTKVLSKVLELLMFPVLRAFADKNGYEMFEARQQNQYPDLSFVAGDRKYALDIKSTFRTGIVAGAQRVNGMTLGTFMGYFRNRDSASISTFPYRDYEKHYVLGVVYTQVEEVVERISYDVGDLSVAQGEREARDRREAAAQETGDDGVRFVDRLSDIPSVAKEFTIFIQEKYRIAADRPGSGNTKNIGSTTVLDRMVNGQGDFANLGIDVFDDYWMNYRTKEMAKADDLKERPYKNLFEYRDHLVKGKAMLDVPPEQIISEDVMEQREGEP